MSATHYEAGARVVVVAAIDPNVADVSRHIGATGLVRALDYSGLVGDSHPADPMLIVDLDSGVRESFWREELEGAGQ